MDPLSALSIATGIITFVDFGCKLNIFINIFIKANFNKVFKKFIQFNKLIKK